ncbi:MAG: hypothetical protein COB98_00465 [Flavobacteriaceae bacterium]|nr:MAG: hypothetical protein COB98_00465 [Flavobacteriaceae bacterium]
MQVMEMYGYNGYKISKEVEVLSESKITNIRLGKREPSLDMIKGLIGRFPDISYAWLITGEGEAICTKERFPDEKHLTDKELDFIIRNVTTKQNTLMQSSLFRNFIDKIKTEERKKVLKEVSDFISLKSN